ncbi:prepilin peptidase [Nannocystis pusilla]|uniref:prepilin peptidase n=1 Tax=Nannocystis pusilla TaxID=889268 RepID=UPI003B7FC006
MLEPLLMLQGPEALELVETNPVLVKALMAPWAPWMAFFFGTLWGSFANVAIWRLPRGLSVVRPGSACPACETPIAWYDNIPVLSYLLLRGRCRRCGEPFALRYLVVELLGGVLSFTLYLQFVLRPMVQGGPPGLLEWLLWFCFGLGLLIATYTDLDLWLIPDEVVLPIAGLGLVVAAISPATLGVGVIEAALAAACGYLLIAGLRWVYLRYRGIEALGLGDGKLLCMIGAFAGARGLMWTLAAGAIQGLLVAVPMLLLGRRVANTALEEVHGEDPELGEEDPDAGVMGARVPFGPFLALAAFEYMFLREHIEALWAALVSP